MNPGPPASLARAGRKWRTLVQTKSSHGQAFACTPLRILCRAGAAALVCVLVGMGCSPSAGPEPAPVETGAVIPDPAPDAPASGAADPDTGAQSAALTIEPFPPDPAGEPGISDLEADVADPSDEVPPSGSILAPGTDTVPISADRPLRVGVLLPLSGAYAATGRALWNAVEMALFEGDAEHVELVVGDTASDAQAARAAFLQLADAGIDIVVGPLFSWATAEVVAEAEGRGIPVLALSNDIAEAARPAWMLGVHPRGEVLRILRYALDHPDQRVGLIVPETEFGDAVADAFRDALPPVRVLGLVRYHPRSDPATVAQQFLDGAPRAGTRARDAVLIAARGNALRAIAAELAYRNNAPEGLRYLGLSGWRTSGLQGEPVLQGGLFADLPEEPFADFSDRYQRIYGAAPSRTAALAYDAAALAVSLTAVEPGNRAAWLEAPEGFSGLLGMFRLLSDGTVERGFAVYEVRREGYAVVQAPPSSFVPAEGG